MQNTQKTSYWQDTNVYISENKLDGDLKISQNTGNVFFFLVPGYNFTETQWNLAKIDESVIKTYKTHKKHRIDRIQTSISLEINLMEVWKWVRTLEMYYSFLYLHVIFIKTQWNLTINETVNKTYKTHKKHRIDRIQTCISLKIN